MKNFFYIAVSYIISTLFLWWFYDDFLRIKFELPYLKYYEVVAIHMVFRFFFFGQIKDTYKINGNFETLPMKDFFNKINKR
tara:strand:+ start:517 stop:759 length:243 start_codon:yes stop_codon:yes gene_type:complete